MKKSYAVATIQGRVASKPERGEWNGKEFADFDVAVTRKTYNGEEEVIINVRTWNEKLFPSIDALAVGQGVQVVADVDSKVNKSDNGGVYYRVSLRPLAIVPGLAASPAPQGCRRPAPDNYGSGNYTPPANARQAAEQRAQLPHEEDDEIPF